MYIFFLRNFKFTIEPSVESFMWQTWKTSLRQNKAWILIPPELLFTLPNNWKKGDGLNNP